MKLYNRSERHDSETRMDGPQDEELEIEDDEDSDNHELEDDEADDGGEAPKSDKPEVGSSQAKQRKQQKAKGKGFLRLFSDQRYSRRLKGKAPEYTPEF